MEKKKAITWGIIGLVIGVLVLSVIGISYAYWINVFNQKNTNAIITNCFKMSFEEDTTSNISLENAYPILDEEGRELNPYVFSIENICTSTNSYQINMESMEYSTMPDRVMKVLLNDGEGILLREEVTPTIGERAYKLESGYIYPGEKKSYEVRVWMDESTTMADTDAMNKNFVGKITVTGTYINVYQESILNGTDPVLKEGLIPVTISDTGEVSRADISEEWYSYEEKIWANAVILENENVSYDVGETIPESNIESYFVWVPRYRYKIFNDGNYTGLTTVENKVQTIEIEFENKNTAVSNGSTVGSWLTHPVFTSFDVNGMWVGKFETGYKGANSTTAAEVNENEPGNIQIKPNVYSWRYIQPANMHLNSYNYKRKMNSHMMKNTEWGAVAYLQHSVYGSQASVRFNNNEGYITGYSAISEPTCGYTGTNEECNKYESTALGVDGVYTLNYFNQASVVSSTTGNYSGVYDMSGGAWEYVMGVMLDINGEPMSGRNSISNSGFNGSYGCPTCDTSSGNNSSITSLTTGVNFPDSKYYDVYAYAENDKTYNRRILGDATGEMGPFATATYGTSQRQIGSWYADECWFVNSTWPWFRRGSDVDYGASAGVFAISVTNGYALVDASFRIVLAV